MAVEEINADMERGLALIDGKLQRFFKENTKKSSCVALSNDEYMTLYTTVYRLCTDKHNRDANAANLYALYRSSLAGYLAADATPSLKRLRGVSLLRELHARWLTHAQLVRCLSRAPFGYLDRCYLARNNLPSLWDAGVMCFRDAPFEALKAEATAAVLELIERDRKGGEGVGSAERGLAKRVAVDVFVAMGIGELRCYEEDFEAAMLAATAEFYAREAAGWIEADSCPEYLAKAEERLTEERDRAENYLHPSSEPKLAETVRHALLVAHAARLFEKDDSGLRALVRDNNTDDVKTIFRLYGELPEQLGLVAELFGQHVTEDVKALVQAAEGGSTDVIRKLIELHDRYDGVYLVGCFDNHELFQKALTVGFEEFGTKPVAATTSAELIAIFCDEILRKGDDGGKMSDDDINKIFESIVQLLVYVSDKDMFVEFYRKRLSHRLLFGRSASSEHEKSFLAKMKLRLGVEFTSSMEGMIKDMTMAKENDENFKKYLSENSLLVSDGVNISVTVLTINKWPSYKFSHLVIPAEMARSSEAYTKFYSAQYPNRKLTWLYSLGTCHIKVKFTAKIIELVLSTYQALVLMLFESNNTLSYSDVKAGLNIDDGNVDELIRTLHSLSRANYKILLKKPDTTTISNDDVFEFNENFNSLMHRIKVPRPSVAAEESKKVITSVNTDRRYTVDCAIIRIMKKQKVLDNKSLIIECIEFLSSKFKPDVKLIEKRIDDLIERDFLERDEDDSSVLNYVA